MIEKYLEKLEYIKNLPEINDIYLHLGCGNHIFDKWINIDKYYEDSRILKQDIDFQMVFQNKDPYD